MTNAENIQECDLTIRKQIERHSMITDPKSVGAAH